MVVGVGSKFSESRVTPVSALALPPGSYTVTFRSSTFAQPVSTLVVVAPGASRGVHADFTTAVPSVH
jgi:hypothetical protein